jgi:hypothetical protein
MTSNRQNAADTGNQLHPTIASPTSQAAIVCVALTIILIALSNRRNTSRLSFPPGPRSFPLIGNVFDLPKLHSWSTFDKWIKIYGTLVLVSCCISLKLFQISGDIVGFNVMGRPIIILGSSRRVSDLLEKRGADFSSRPRWVMHNEL